jgi:hypothetical protein
MRSASWAVIGLALGAAAGTWPGCLICDEPPPPPALAVFAITDALDPALIGGTVQVEDVQEVTGARRLVVRWPEREVSYEWP